MNHIHALIQAHEQFDFPPKKSHNSPMIKIVQLFKPASFVLALSLAACDNGTTDSFTSALTGTSAAEFQQIQAQLLQSREAIKQLNLLIHQAESYDARMNYNLTKRLTDKNKPVTAFTINDIDNLTAKQRDFQHLCFDVEDMRKNLAQRKQELHALQYQYHAYSKRLEDFKKTHPAE